MRFPTLHINGTGYSTLRSEYHDAYRAVDKSLTALSKVTCHGRDYYVQDKVPGVDATQEAFAEHCERVAALAKVKEELKLIVLNLDAQEAMRK
jgi:hypothetical protein